MDGVIDEAQAGSPNGIDRVASPKIKEEVMEDANGSAFDDIDWAAQSKQDDADIDNMFADAGRLQMPENLAEFGEKDIDQTNKADDAIDYENMSDSDLASEEGSGYAAANGGVSQVPGLTEDEGTSHDTEYMDDLFGGDAEDDVFPSSPPAGDVAPDQPTTPADPDTLPDTGPEKGSHLRDVTDEAWTNMSFEERWKLNFPQHDLSIDKWINQTNEEGSSVQRAPESADELLKQKFPSFENHAVLYFNRLFPEWPAEYLYKEPPNKDRDPPEFVPTKLELELDADCSKLFRIPDNGLSAAHQRANYPDVDEWGNAISAPGLDADEGFSSDSDAEDQRVGGYTLNEIATVCDDWDALLDQPLPSKSKPSVTIADDEDMDDELDEWEKEFLQPRAKKSRPKYEPGLPDISTYDAAGIEHFESATRRSGKRVRLDLNDPYLLIDDMQSERPSKRPKLEEKTKRMANGQLRRDVMHHFNLSNDDAYEALKHNHKSKVRATLSNLSVEHSLPALKLTFPFYRVKVDGQPWEHHRKKFEVEKIVKHAVGVRKPSKVRRKDTKGRSAHDVYRTTKDLSLNDNSTAVLFEYSEQFPIMISNFGMGSRVINYYRRKDMSDEEKGPKLDIGEGYALLPEDRSPFTIFGTVEPGETVPTLHNEMYRAPIFKHEPRPNDFLLGYTTNATEGPRWFLRNIDHVFTVGQTFPSIDVPGPHARRVTNTNKNRLKMIAYRMMKKKETQDVTLNEITPHVFEKPDPQNRQKMKEFLFYDRDRKTWVLPEGERLMDEANIRGMVKPEDVCVIESMQVGKKLILNAGYDPKDKDDNEDEEQPLVVQLAPWRISKNFLDASAGKAMVALHGEGDPTGHGLGFSFIKTSMKGGYINAVQGPLATSADAIERERKANGGHSYNVKKQQEMYNTAIRQIWERQRATLNDSTTHGDADVLDTANEDDRFNERQADATPAPVDDGRSQFSRLSAASRNGRRKLKITRRKMNNETKELETETLILEDQAVIRNYLRQRKEREERNRESVAAQKPKSNRTKSMLKQNNSVYSLMPTADADENREAQRLVDRELSRLLKNQDRRQIREKQGKGKKKTAVNPDASPDPSSADKAAAGTTRKCANCGQVGHIKTNKSKCPLLNGTITTNSNGADHGGFGSFSAPSAGPAANE